MCVDVLRHKMNITLVFLFNFWDAHCTLGVRSWFDPEPCNAKNQAVAVDAAQLLSQNRFIGNLAAGTIASIAKVSGFLETILSSQPSQISQLLRHLSSMGWWKGECTGNHDYWHQFKAFPATLQMNHSWSHNSIVFPMVGFFLHRL